MIEIGAALAHFNNLELYGQEISPKNFSLPTLSTVLKAAQINIFDGKGIFVLRGLNPKDYCPADQVLIFLGISCYIAEKCGKQERRDHLRDDGIKSNKDHYRDDGIKSNKDHYRDDGIKSNKDHYRDDGIKSQYPNRNSTSLLNFHIDRPTDIMTLQTRGCAAKGGDSMLASLKMVYNEYVQTRPDVIRTLATQNWPADVNDPELLGECHKKGLLAWCAQTT